MILPRRISDGILQALLYMASSIGTLAIKLTMILAGTLLCLSLIVSTCSCSNSTIATGTIPDLGGLELITPPYSNPELSGYWEHPFLYVNIFIMQFEIVGVSASTSGAAGTGSGNGPQG